MVDLIRDLCRKNGTTITALEEELQLGKATVRRWDENSPSIAKVARVAERFGVSLDYLMGGDAQQPDEVELSSDTLEIARIIESLPPDHRRLLLAQVRALRQAIPDPAAPSGSE